MAQYRLLETIYFDGHPYAAGSIIDTDKIPGISGESLVHRLWAVSHDPDAAPEVTPEAAPEVIDSFDKIVEQSQSQIEILKAIEANTAEPEPQPEPAPAPQPEPPKPPRRKR